ncbi:DUF397 domain-containing protein [Streptomyces sp. 2112.2]|uniref:DUF397 domain-containing protein n=1 Tax=Streptomyces sp. 2112.2 TaxID=1881024 RepID=UPI000B874FEF
MAGAGDDFERACVEVRRAGATAGVHVADSKMVDGPQLAFRAESWSAFVRTLGPGSFE